MIFLHDALLDFMQHIQDLLAGSMSVVYDKVRMLGGDLCITDREANETAVLDHRSDMVSRRTEVHGAGTSLFERLLGATGDLVFCHFSLDLFRIAGRKMQLYADDDIPIVHEYAVAVAIVQVIPAVGLFFFAVSGDGIDLFYDSLHLTAIAIGVHENRTADRTGDTDSPLEALQAVLFRKASDSTRAGAAAGSDPFAFAGHFLLHTVHANGDATDPLIADERIRAAADHRDSDAFFIRLPEDLNKLFFCLRSDKNVSRAADAIGRMAAHRFIDLEVSLCEDPVEKYFPVCHFLSNSNTSIPCAIASETIFCKSAAT